MTLIIKFIAIVNVATGEIEEISTAPGGDMPTEGPIAGSDPAKELFHLSSEDFAQYGLLRTQEEFYRKDGAWVYRGAKPTTYHKWDTTNERWITDTVALWEQIRFERDQRLAASDWTQMPDVSFEEIIQDEWRIYRQSLREIPQTFSDAETLGNITWPTKPVY